MNRRARLATGLAAVAVVALATWLTSPQVVLARLAWLAANPVWFGAALVGLALVRPLLAWPTTLLAVAAGYGLGVASFPLALALIVLTSVPPYLFARRTRTAGGRVATAGEQFVNTTGDLRSVTASRLLPAPSDVVSIGAGVAGVPLRAFVLGTALGEIPWATAGVLAGASMDALAQEGLRTAFDVRLVAAAGLVAVLLLAQPVYQFVSAGMDERGKSSNDSTR